MKIDIQFNPKVRDLIENKNISVIGLAWATTWRLWLLVLEFLRSSRGGYACVFALSGIATACKIIKNP